MPEKNADVPKRNRVLLHGRSNTTKRSKIPVYDGGGGGVCTSQCWSMRETGANSKK